jgi:hypothetical protein
MSIARRRREKRPSVNSAAIIMVAKTGFLIETSERNIAPAFPWARFLAQDPHANAVAQPRQNSAQERIAGPHIAEELDDAGILIDETPPDLHALGPAAVQSIDDLFLPFATQGVDRRRSHPPDRR